MKFHRRSKNNKKPILRQVLDLIPAHIFRKSVSKFQTDKGCHKYMTYDQMVALSFGQLGKCYTLSDISCGLSISSTFMVDLGLKQNPVKSTMSDGNKNRDYRVFEDIYYQLIKHYRHTLTDKRDRAVIEEIKNETIKLIDSSTVSLCLNLFDWAKFRTAKGGLKIHTVWDDTLGLPDYINITNAKLHDSKGLINQIFPKGTIIVEDRAYFDFELFRKRIDAKNVFVTRLKSNILYESVEELDLPDGRDQNILKDELIKFTGKEAKKAGLEGVIFRLVTVYKEDENKVIHLITNQVDWQAITIADLYKKRWDIEIFFKLMKQNLQIKTFLGTSENAVKSQIYVAMIVFLLLELIRRVYCKGKTAFSNFCEKVRICLLHYLSFEYLCSINGKVQKVMKPPGLTLFDQDNFCIQTDLFS
ncbi:MAG: IS4 family transposase [Peptostreptococcaceae bacterium]|nr:IS4 family transposase [Peptostreptococcaceae bacterium]